MPVGAGDGDLIEGDIRMTCVELDGIETDKVLSGAFTKVGKLVPAARIPNAGTGRVAMGAVPIGLVTVEDDELAALRFGETAHLGHERSRDAHEIFVPLAHMAKKAGKMAAPLKKSLR